MYYALPKTPWFPHCAVVEEKVCKKKRRISCEDQGQKIFISAQSSWLCYVYTFTGNGK